MEQIVGEEFFHVNRKPDYGLYSLMELEESFKVGEKFNPFFKNYFTKPPPTFNVTHTDDDKEKVSKFYPLAYFERFKDKTLSTSNIEQLGGEAYESIKYCLMHWREVLCEHVRFCDFPDMPSRQRCMWLTHTSEEADFWQQRIDENDVEIPSQIVKVRVTGKIHVADAKLLMNESDNLEQAYSNAKKYWRGEKAEGEREKEVLFEGTGAVIEII